MLPLFFYSVATRENFLCNARLHLSHFDYSLLYEVLSEWETSPILSSLFRKWEIRKAPDSSPTDNALSFLSFNVRGLDLRLQEVILLAIAIHFDIMILLETGSFDMSLCRATFPDYKIFAQNGENPHGGCLILARNNLKSSNIACDVPNVCAIDIYESGDESIPFRIVGVYASDCRSWSWEALSPLITAKCALFGDFNVDLQNG